MRRTGTRTATGTKRRTSRPLSPDSGVASSWCRSSSTGRRARSRSTSTAGARSWRSRCARAHEAGLPSEERLGPYGRKQLPARAVRDPRAGDSIPSSPPSAGFAGATEFGGRFGRGAAPPSEDILTTVSGYTIVVPAFNEESGLPTVLEELGRACPEAEIVVGDDGWTDGTGSVAREFPVTVVSHPVNRGYGAALKTGIAQAKHDRVVFFDADGQHDPARIRSMLEALGSADLVIGERSNYSR